MKRRRRKTAMRTKRKTRMTMTMMTTRMRTRIRMRNTAMRMKRKSKMFGSHNLSLVSIKTKKIVPHPPQIVSNLKWNHQRSLRLLNPLAILLRN